MLGTLTACAGSGALRVSPAEIPELQRGLEAQPDDPDLRLRFAAALFADGRCTEARVQAETAAALSPDNGVTPLIQGQCLEAAGRVADAVDVYGAYLRQYPEADGADAVRGRLLLAERTLATVQAEAALAREAEIGSRPAQPGVVAVVPVAVLGDPEGRFRPLSRALAQMLISDLSLTGRLRLVERLQMEALLAEVALVESGRVEAATAIRLGRLVRAESLVQGALVVDGANLRLEATLTEEEGARAAADDVSGGVRDLLRMEKWWALSLADRLAGPLTAAEEQAILDNGPSSVDAFLDWADGLILEEQGDFAAAAAAYRRASAADPGFADAARRARRAASAVTVIGRSPSEVVGLGRVAARAASEVANPGLAGALGGAVLDVAPLGSEVAMGSGPGSTAAWSPGARQPTPALPVDVILRVLVRIPR